MLPAASTATTVYVYVVCGRRPVLVKVVAEVVAITLPLRVTRYPVTATSSLEALQERSISDDDTAAADRFAGTVGGVLSFAAVTATSAAVPRLPAASRAEAESVWAPLVAATVSQSTVYGATVSSAPRFAPSNANWTPTTPTLSEASAVTDTLPATVAPPAGAVIVTVGFVASGTGGAIGLFMSLWTSACVSARPEIRTSSMRPFVRSTLPPYCPMEGA